MKLDVRVKKLHKDAIIPSYSKDGDAGLDLTAISKVKLGNHKVKYGFGLAFEIPKGHVGYVFPRSSIYKKNTFLTNSVGVIDSGYRGEVSAIFEEGYGDIYEIGDRIAQLIIMPIPTINLISVKELQSSERGIGGFGSTGN